MPDCPLCGIGFVVAMTRDGRFQCVRNIKCSKKFTATWTGKEFINVAILDKSKLSKIPDVKIIEMKCEKCGGPMLVRLNNKNKTTKCRKCYRIMRVMRSNKFALKRGYYYGADGRVRRNKDGAEWELGRKKSTGKYDG